MQGEFNVVGVPGLYPKSKENLKRTDFVFLP